MPWPFDISIASLREPVSFAPLDLRVEPDSVQQDITPASTRRSDGDTRFLTIQSESFWAQSDWSAGFGRGFPPDATSFQDGVAYTVGGTRLLAPLGHTNGPWDPNWLFLMGCLHNGHVWVCIYIWNTTPGQLWLLEQDYTTGNWTNRGALPTWPTHMVSFRDGLYISYGEVWYTQRWTPGSGLAIAPPNWTSQMQCPFSSMLFFVYQHASEAAWSLGRFDPENPATTATPVARFSFGGLVDKPSAMVAVGQDLFIVFGRSLWKFSSQNSTLGILSGPHDEWVPEEGGAGYAGRGVMHQGALYYTLGRSLRRYVPGGQARNVWPVPAQDVAYGKATTNGSDLILALCSFGDRLFLLVGVVPQVAGFQSPNHTWELWCWTGIGMHRIGRRFVSSSASMYEWHRSHDILGTQDGRIWLMSQHQGTLTAGSAIASYNVSGQVASAFDTYGHVQYVSSIQDFGMFDILKQVTAVGVAVAAVAPQSVRVFVRVDGTAEEEWLLSAGVGGALALPASVGVAPRMLTQPGTPEIRYFVPPNSFARVGARFRISVKFEMAGIGDRSPEVYAVMAIPNPLNPLRRGFRVTVIVDEMVVDHEGKRLYADATAVRNALVRLRDLRTEEYPLSMYWLDDQAYHVRVNTQTIRRVASQDGRAPGYRVAMDLQEITG